ncbi:MAG: OB-fold domain-containing protein [Ilumatobacteraceae bacterium]
MSGIVSYGAYVPYWRLQRSAITAALGGGGGKGLRSVASYDEDSTSMGVEAVRRALQEMPSGYTPQLISFATTSPAYFDKTNATAIHAALALPASVAAFDAVGSVRSGVGAVLMAAAVGGAAVLSDVRTGLPGGADESGGGDAAVAICFAQPGSSEPVIAELVARHSVTAEFVERWREPGATYSKQWEERFGEHAYMPLAEEAIGAALKASGLAIGDFDRVIVSGLHTRAVNSVRKSIGATAQQLGDDLTAEIGNTATAHWAILLADALDSAAPDQQILVANLADGCDVMVVRTTAALAGRRRDGNTVRAQIASTRTDLTYAQFLTWRGMLHREPPRRPEPDRPAGPPSLRSTAWKFGLIGSRDEAGFVHLPPARVSMVSGAIDQMEEVRMADISATIATYAIDRLAYSLSPPVVAAVIDFDGGGRFQCELTDVDPSTVAIGDRVQMTFRRLYVQDGIHDYFWKAKPLRG